MLKGRLRAGVIVFVCCASGCGGGDGETSTSSKTSASTTSPDAGTPAGILPASYAGTSTEQGPGLPFDFVGTVTRSIPLSVDEQAAIADANAKAKLRNPPTKSPVDRGFGTKAAKATGGQP